MLAQGQGSGTRRASSRPVATWTRKRAHLRARRPSAEGKKKKTARRRGLVDGRGRVVEEDRGAGLDGEAHELAEVCVVGEARGDGGVVVDVFRDELVVEARAAEVAEREVEDGRLGREDHDRRREGERLEDRDAAAPRERVEDGVGLCPRNPFNLAST